jgi:hypothetical protein
LIGREGIRNAASIHKLTDRSVYRRPGLNPAQRQAPASRGVGTRIGDDDQKTVAGFV